MRQLPAAVVALLLVLSVVWVLREVSPTQMGTELDSLHDVEPRTAAARSACARVVIDQLAHAFNSGDTAGVVALLDDATTPLRAFSVAGPRLDWVENDARRAADRFLARHAAGERWSVERVDAAAGPSWHGAIDVTLVLTRQASDLPEGQVRATGTAVLSCVSGRIASLRIVPA